MEKMYSRQDVVRLVALERDRCINIVHNRIREAERLGRARPALAARMKSAVEFLDKTLLAVVNGKMNRNEDYEEQLKALVLKDYFGEPDKSEK